MRTIKDELEHEIIIKNSRFITLIYKINDNNIDKYIEHAKEKYPKATHYTYGYIINNYKKSSDDGEPTGTAGMPIINVLEKEKLENILIIIVRYFGGIKLGAGGLIRAYTKAVTETLKEAKYINLAPGYKVEISFDYQQEKQINYLLQKSTILEKSFDEQITYLALIDEETLNNLSKYNFNIIDQLYIEKLDTN